MICLLICFIISICVVVYNAMNDELGDGILYGILTLIFSLIVAFVLSLIFIDDKYEKLLYETIVSFDDSSIINTAELYGSKYIFIKESNGDFYYKKEENFNKIENDVNGKKYMVFQVVERGKSPKLLFNLRSSETIKYIYVGDLKDFKENVIFKE